MATTETATQEHLPWYKKLKASLSSTGGEKAPADVDPFASQRESVVPLPQNGEKAKGDAPSSPVDRRESTEEWDAAKTPPSRFQQRKGSVYATPGSRDGHVDKNYARDAKFHELVDKKYGGKRRPSTASKGEKPEV